MNTKTLHDLSDALAEATRGLLAASQSYEIASLSEIDAEHKLKDRQQELVATGAIMGKNAEERAAQLHVATEPERLALRNRATAAANARFALDRASETLRAMRDQLRIAEITQERTQLAWAIRGSSHANGTHATQPDLMR